MKVHLLRQKPGHFPGFPKIFAMLSISMAFLIGIKPTLLAEGSKDFVNYPGLRMFLDTRDEQQLKVYAAAGETINIGSSHIGIQGGFINVYDPNGNLVVTYNNTGATTGIGIINNSTQEMSGPTGGGSTMGTGYVPGVITVDPADEGVWTVVFDYPFYSNSPFTNIANSASWTRADDQPNTTRVVLAWDITITQGGAGNEGGTPVEGRVYSNEHISLLQGNSTNTNSVSTSPTFFVLTEDGFLYEVDVMGADPYRFPISSNSLGLTDSDGQPVYRSLDRNSFIRDADPSSWTAGNIYLYEPQAEDAGPLINNKIFFNIPAADLPKTAQVTDVFRSNPHETWMLETLEDLVIDSLYLFAETTSGVPCSPGTIEFGKGGFFIFDTNLGGVVTLQIDLNNNNIYTDSIDVTLSGTLNEGLDSLFWNGQDGFGNFVPVQDSLTINYQGSVRYGELHIAMTDVEGMQGGVTFEWLNPPAGSSFPTDQFYYDHSLIDSNFAVSVSGTGIPGNATATNVPYIYPLDEGNDDYMDQWFFVEQAIVESSIVVDVVIDCFCDPVDIPELSISGMDVCAGEAITLTASNSNAAIGPIDYAWNGPNAYQFDDLGVDPTTSSIANVSASATTAEAGTYTVIGTTASNCADTVSLNVMVTLTPVLEAVGDPLVQICENSDVQICATNIVAGLGIINCEWNGPNGFSESSMVDGDGQICISLTSVSQQLEGDYTLVCSSNGCESDPLIITLDIQPTPEINGLTQNASYCVGDDVVFTASNNVLGTGDIIYSWVGPNFTLVDTTVNNEVGPFAVTLPDVQLTDAGDYVLTLTTLAGCASAPQTVTIGVNELPLVCNATGGGDACVGQNVLLSAFNCAGGLSGETSFEWTAPDGSIACSGTLMNDGPFECGITDIQPVNSGEYCLTLTDVGTGCASAPFCLEVNVLPSINITNVTPDGSYCGGEDVLLTGSTSFGSNVVYTWTGPGGMILCSDTATPGTPLSCTITDLDADSEGDYVLTVTSLDGCVADPVTVNVSLLDFVEIAEITGGGTYCNGDMVTLSGTGSSASGSVAYTWIDPNGDTLVTTLGGPTGPWETTLTNPLNGFYILSVASNPDQCADIDSVNVQFSETPVGLILNGTDTALCERDSLVLCAQNTNATIGDFTYTWTAPDGTTISGAGNGLTPFCEEIVPADTYGAGTYSLEICADNCCSEIVDFQVELYPTPELTFVSGGGVYCEGDTAIVCFTNSNPAVTEWFYTCNIDTFQTTGMGMGTDTICIAITESTFIFCSMESTEGCVSDLASTQVTFEPNFTPEIDTIISVCANDTLTLNGSNSSTCTGDVTYTWTGPGGFTFTETAPCNGPFPAMDPSPESGEYCLSLDSGTGSNCSEPACTTIVVFELPFIVGGTIDGGGDFCEGDDVLLSAQIENPSGGDISFEWTQDGIVVATGTAGSGEFIELDLGAIALDQAGEYCLNLTCLDTGCSDEGIGCTQVTVSATPVIDDVTGAGTYCQGFDVMLGGSGPVEPGTVTYTWTGPNGYMFMGTAPCGGPYPATIDDIDVDDEGLYTLVVMKGDCVSDEATVVVEVNPTPDIINVSSGGAECEGDSIMISFTIDPDGAANVDWTISGPGLDEMGNVTVLTDFTFDIVVAGDATYVITAVSDQGCEADPMNITITEISVPVPVITATPDMPCPGEAIEFCTDLVTGASYSWCLDGTQIAGPSMDPCFIELNPVAGNYTVKITIDGCTKESAPYTLTYPPSPTANDDSYTTDAGIPVSGNVLDNDDIGIGVTVTVVSQPNNGTVTVNEDGEFTYTPDNGFSGTDQFTYEICSVECPEDCDQATVTIVVETPPCEIPNVITPDGDEINDILVIDCVPGFPNNRLRIFNRWGDELEVFEPYENTWDGTIGASKDPVPAGTYFYLFQEDRNSDDHVAGYVKVVR